MSANRHGVKDFVRGRPLVEQLKADKLNAILKELESLRITSVVNGSFKKLPGGTEIVIPKSRNIVSQIQPWDLVPRKDSTGNAYTVEVQPGTLNGILPSNWDEEFACASSGLYYAKAVITTDGSNITALSIEIDTTAPTAQAPVKFGVATSVKYLFGLFSQGQVYRVIANGHIVLQPEQWLIASADPAANPGESPYDIYYRLQ